MAPQSVEKTVFLFLFSAFIRFHGMSAMPIPTSFLDIKCSTKRRFNDMCIEAKGNPRLQEENPGPGTLTRFSGDPKDD
jgi:hypothetical protein